MQRITTRDSLAPDQPGLPLLSPPFCSFRYTITSPSSACSAKICLGPNKLAVKALWPGSACHPLQTETFCPASSLRSGLGSPQALSQEGDRMMAWGREERKAWQSEPATSITSSTCLWVFWRRRACRLFSVPGFPFCLILGSTGRRKLRLFPVSSLWKKILKNH